MLDKRKTLSEGEVLFFMRQLISGIDYLNRQLVSHRDLRPANLLVGNNLELKICDFGSATKFEKCSQSIFEMAGNDYAYMAPEMLNKGGYNIGMIDRWAIGVLIYRMLVGTTPFTVKDDIPHY